MNITKKSGPLALAFVIILTPSLKAQDKDQHIEHCGTYQASGHLECMKMSHCSLILGKGSRSEIKVLIQDKGKDISYFDDENVELKLLVTKFGKSPVAHAIETPLKVVSAIGHSGMKLNKIEACSE